MAGRANRQGMGQGQHSRARVGDGDDMSSALAIGLSSDEMRREVDRNEIARLVVERARLAEDVALACLRIQDGVECDVELGSVAGWNDDAVGRGEECFVDVDRVGGVWRSGGVEDSAGVVDVELPDDAMHADTTQEYGVAELRDDDESYRAGIGQFVGGIVQGSGDVTAAVDGYGRFVGC